MHLLFQLKLLYRLSNEKPSAIFRLKGSFTSQTSIPHAAFHSPDGSDASLNDATAILGIAIEPLQAILSQMPNGTGSIVSAGTATPSDPGLVAEKVVRHLFNYLSSFSTALTPDSAIPLGVITRWYESFLTKVRSGGIAFLDREN